MTHTASRVVVSEAKAVNNPHTHGLLQLKVRAANSHAHSVNEGIKDLKCCRSYLKEIVLGLLHDKFPNRPKLFYKIFRKLPASDGGCGEASPVWLNGGFSGFSETLTALEWEDGFDQLRYGSSSFCAALKTAIDWHRDENGVMWFSCDPPSDYDSQVSIRRLRREELSPNLTAFFTATNPPAVNYRELRDICCQVGLYEDSVKTICDGLPSSTTNSVAKILAHSLFSQSRLTRPAVFAQKMASSKLAHLVAGHMVLRSIEIARKCSSFKIRGLRDATQWDSRFENYVRQ